MSVDNLLIAGCSFTASVDSWATQLQKIINPLQCINIGVSGAGNYTIGTNIVYFLELKKNYTSKNTTVVFNVSGLDRIDTMCPVDHPNANNYWAWDKDLGFNWINQGGFTGQQPPFNGMLQKHMGIDQIIKVNSLAIIQCISYLELNNFKYYFMLMDDQICKDSPTWFTKFLEQRRDKWITFDTHKSMYSYALANDQIGNDGFHPSPAGQILIAQAVASIINKLGEKL
jgi:hypothetical protein